MPKSPNSAPLFGVDGVVYLRASAQLGFLEAYRIDNVLFNKPAGVWQYQINVQKSLSAGNTIGGTNDLQRSRILYFNELELVDLCEALTLKVAFHTSELNKASQMKAARCDGSGTGS